jgi:hypothetical protein
MKKHLFTLITILINIVVSAQPTYPPPSGVYCSCPPTTGIGAGSVDPTVASKSFVKGILVRIGWKDIEPADNTYNWALLDNQIIAANSYGKKISLAIGGGPNSPSWLYSLGTQSISYTVPFPGTIPVLWDLTFLTKWTEFVRDLGDRYKNDTTINLVYITNATANGFEMQLPFSPTPSYTSISYTDTKVINSWKQVIDTFSVVFPNHYLSNDFHPVNGSNTVADSIYAYAKLKISNRYGANAWWWTQNNTTYYSSQYNILLNSVINNTFTGIQMAYSGTTDSASFGAGGMPSALQLAISDGICYWEIWNQDIVNPNFTSLLTNSTCSGVTGIIEAKNKLATDFRLYPNPSHDFSIIELSDQHFDLSIFDFMGRIIYQKQNCFDKTMLPTQNYKKGVYFVQITTGKSQILNQKLIIN